MRCRLDLKSFKRAFAKAAKASNPRSPMVVMQSVLLDLSDPHAPTLVATDGEVAAKVPLVGAIVDVPGKVLLPRQVTENILAVATGDVIGLESDEARVVARCGQGRWTLSTQDPALFPDAFARTADPAFVADSGDLATAIRRTAYAAEKESSKYALQGIKLEWSGGKLTLVAADGYRMAVQEIEAETITPDPDGESRLLPPKLAFLLISAFDDEPTPVEVSFPGGSMASFRFAGHVVAGRMLEGRFPAWRNFTAGDPSHRYTLPTDRVRDAIGQAAAVASETTKRIDLEFSAGTLAVSSPESEVGSSRVEVPIDHSGPPITLAVRPDHFLSALKALDAPEIGLVLRGKLGPVGIVIDGFEHHAMPMTVEK